MLIISDIETIVVLLTLFVIFKCGLKKKTISNTTYSLDLNFSTALKGISCIFILLGHFMNIYYNKYPETIVSKIVYATTANLALIIFMFISGYGLSLKKTLLDCDNASALVDFKERLKKILYPFFIVVIVTHIIYLILPNTLPEEFLIKYRIPSFSGGFLDFFNNETLPRLRYMDWYVICICIFYAIFYVSIYVFNNIKNNNISESVFTYILFIFLMIYYLIALNTLDSDKAHYYRYPWAFFAGHLLARLDKCNRKQKYILILLFVLLIMTWELDTISIAVNITSIIFIYVFLKLNQRYIYKGKSLLWLGSISYFFYLCHERISWVLMGYTKLISPIIWISITLLIAYLLSYFYKHISNRL